MKGWAWAVISVVLAGITVLADDAREKAARKDLETFAGQWKAASVERDGKKAPDEELADVFVTHEGNKVTVRKGDKVVVQGTIELDPTKNPRTLDFTSTAEQDKGKIYPGIYKFEGDSYRLCLAAPEKKRPTEFSSKLGALIVAGLVVKVYPDAKKDLLSRGRTAAEIDAMPALQVAVIHLVEQYDDLKDDYLKWLSLPSWQMWAGLERNEPRLMERAQRDNPLVGLLLPAVSKVIKAQLRLEWHIAGLRNAEALRMYAAGHNGQPPQKLADITEVPLPLDPFTGRDFEASYSLKNGKGTLELLRTSVLMGRRYELTAPSEK